MSASKDCLRCQHHLTEAYRAMAMTKEPTSERDRAEYNRIMANCPRVFFDCDNCGRHMESFQLVPAYTCQCGRIFNYLGYSDWDKENDPVGWGMADAIARRTRAIL